MKNLFSRFAKDDSGATAIEYGLIAAIVAVVLVGALVMVGGGLETAFTNINTELTKTTR